MKIANQGVAAELANIGYSGTESNQPRTASSWPSAPGDSATMPSDTAVERHQVDKRIEAQAGYAGDAAAAVGEQDVPAAVDEHGCVRQSVVAMLKDAGAPSARSALCSKAAVLLASGLGEDDGVYGRGLGLIEESPKQHVLVDADTQEWSAFISDKCTTCTRLFR